MYSIPSGITKPNHIQKKLPISPTTPESIKTTHTETFETHWGGGKASPLTLSTNHFLLATESGIFEATLRPSD